MVLGEATAALSADSGAGRGCPIRSSSVASFLISAPISLRFAASASCHFRDRYLCSLSRAVTQWSVADRAAGGRKRRITPC